MKTIRKLKWMLFVVMASLSMSVFGQTHIYITGSDTGNSTGFHPAPPSGTPAANIVGSFYAAVERANAVGGNCIIHLRTNTLLETQGCSDIQEGVNIQVINDTPQRKAIPWKPAAYKTSHRMVGVRGTLTLGGEGCTSALILSCQEGREYYYPSEFADDGTDARVLLKVEGNGVLNIQENCELSYGKVNVWLASPNATVNQSSGVICAAGDMNVNITQGTYNMSGGYITGANLFFGNTAIPDPTTDTSIFNYDYFIPAHFTQNGTMDYWIDRNEIRDALEAYYPLDTVDPLARLNNATGVYIHGSKDASGSHLAKFNMTGGSICGIYGDGNRPVIIGSSGDYDYQYATKPEDEGGDNYLEEATTILNNGGECRISGGKIYLNHTTGPGGGVRSTCWDFDKEATIENFEHTHTYMSGGEISYCSGSTGGAMRIQFGATVELSGNAKLTHCVANPTDDGLNDTLQSIRGGSGAIRIVGSKLVMTDNAEISWCHSMTVSEAMNGGGIAAVWQPGFGNIYTTVHLHGGSIHHCKSRGYAGGLSATDKGNPNVMGGVIVSIKGCSIHDNYAAKHGAGIYIGGNTSVYIDKADNDTTKAAIYNNTAGINGGGIFISSSHMQEGGVRGLLDASNCNIYGNHAINGGGIYTEYADVKIHDGSSIYDHNIPGNGAGVCIAKEADYTQDGGTVGNTTVATANRAAGKGGGFYVKDGNVTISGGEVVNNTSYADGGGGYVDGGIVYMDGGEIFDNQAVNGAGMFVNGGTFTLESGFIHGNDASTNGGGVFMNGGNFTHISGEVGKLYSNPNTAVKGAGVYMNGGNYTMSGGYINGNAATADGGGVYMNNGDFSFKGGRIGNGESSKNSAVDGAGVYMKGGKFTMKAGQLRGNYASNNGGGVFSTGGTCEITGGYVGYSGSDHNEAGANGGGIYSAGGLVTLDNDSTSLYVRYNKATNGAGIYTTTDGSITIEKSVAERVVEIRSNEASNDGGGVYAGGNITITGGNVSLNKSVKRGGGVFVDGGIFSFSDGVIGGQSGEGNYTTDNSSYGGGVFVNSGTATITGGSISGNHTDNDGQGGGIYMNGGTCTLSGGATIGGSSLAYANNAKYGGGICSANGSITVEGGIIDHNTAVDGGGIYSNGPDATVKITKEGDVLSYMRYNRAGDERTPGNGGGIYANRGKVEFTDGNILYNHASEAGGGMYVNDEGTLLLKGNAILNKNHVPTGKKGGGVYLRGTVKVGEEGSKAQSSVKADMNFAHKLEGAETAEGYTPNDDTRNNIYLPDPVAHAYTEAEHRDVIWVYEGGIADDSHVGFSVPHNHVPVIYCKRSSTSWDYLERFTTGDDHDLNTVLFDDTQRYKSVHYTDSPYFNPDHVYLYGFWPEAVTSLADVPAGGYTVSNDTITIGNEEGFAWLISVVNGRYDKETGTWPVRPDDLSGKTVTLESDLDMKAFGWVPIGFKGNESVSTPAPFRGTFNGKGHTIEGINGLVYGQGNQGVRDFGLFGYVNGGTIENVFLKNAEYYVDDNPNLVLGLLASELEGTANVNNSEASGKLVAQSPNAIMGGLVGRTGNGGTGTPTIHSAIAIADMTGGTMGGLVGHNVKGDVLNSFAYTKFTRRSDATSSHYCGGLVAVNRGRVENCYARLRGAAPGNFGILVGDNAGGTVRYSYAPTSQYTVTGKEGVLEGVGTYGTTYLPYLYKHRDTQVAATNDYVPTDASADKQLMIVLNKWVNHPDQASGNYTKWGRPWQESDAQKPLNDDYPILKMPMAEAVAAKAGDPYLYYNPVDSLLVRYTDAESAIWLYRNPSDTVRGDNDNSTSAAKLYIAEDVVLLNDNPLKAYVGITLDNSAGANGGGANPTYGSFVGIETDETDWHMIATPLSDAHVGIDYQNDNTAYDFSWGHPDDMPYYRFYPKGHEMNGYFPSMRYDWASENDFAYNASAASADGNGNYYKEWDFYSYDEPTYHWINFKRNKASHHYLDIEDHPTLTYTNEEVMVPGKGYFAATREETFLQCQGHLNADEVTIGLTHTPNIPRHGYNLIGNPYQAYLNFNAFADANWGDDGENIWGEGETPSYTILDEDYLEQGTNVETLFGSKPVFYKTFSYRCSSNPDVNAGGFIHPHQGFFVRLGEDRTGATASFSPDQRNATDTVTSKFRGNDHIDYPLVNLFAIEENGAADVVTVELGRPDEGGAPLMESLRVGNGKIWCHYNDKDYAIAYTQPGITEVAIRFESVKDTEYTMRWSTRNGDFSYLHLIDNMTGADVDCLTTDEYRFSASTSDYKSRFRLVFGYTGIEEDSEAEANENFAFMMNDALVVTGEGVLQVFDMTGRMVTSQELHGVQTTVSLPNAANGVYVLRLTEGKQSRIQKMVISK